jgi:hypothetical protein
MIKCKTDKVTESLIKDWLIKYKKNNNNLRLGQSFANHFFDRGYSDNKLFYQENDTLSINHILKHYINYSR